jgi:multidrug efflux pump subunit AcrA (membrane-fusion protein)
MKKRKRSWSKWALGLTLVGVCLIGLAASLGIAIPGLNGWMSEGATVGVDDIGAIALGPDGLPVGEAITPTVPIQRAVDFLPDLRVSGKLEWRTVVEVKAPFEESIDAVNVVVGDLVSATQELASLSTTKLTAQFDSAWLELTQQRQALADLSQENSEIAQMEANAELLAAQEELEKLEKGPAALDVTGAKIALESAQTGYDELLKRNDPNSQKVRAARYAQLQAEKAVQQAQSAYDAIAWKGDKEAEAAASALQAATVSLEDARRAYDEAQKPPSELEVTKAQLEVSKAKNEYNKLFQKATPAQIETARVRVRKAQEKLETVKQGPAPIKRQEAENKVLEALNKFEEIRTKLLSTRSLQAPIDGMVVRVAVTPQQTVKSGDVVVVVATPTQFKIKLQVSEIDILKISEGMPVSITLDVLPEQTLSGVVARIPPIELTTDSSGNASAFASGPQLSSYPVIVNVADSTLAGRMRAGMSAQITFIGSNQLAENSWLVPLTSLTSQEQVNDKTIGTIEVRRGEAATPLQVEVTTVSKGEWVVVVSPELTETDRVVGTVSSFLDQQPNPFGGP